MLNLNPDVEWILRFSPGIPDLRTCGLVRRGAELRRYDALWNEKQAHVPAIYYVYPKAEWSEQEALADLRRRKGKLRRPGE
jgi:hypothetical protein